MEKQMNERIAILKKHGKSAQGRKELLKHFNGGKLTRKQAILANCYDCTCYYADGRKDCKMSECPLYPYMPYSSNKIMQKPGLSEQDRARIGARLLKSRKHMKHNTPGA